MTQNETSIAQIVKSSGKILFASAELNFLLIDNEQIENFVKMLNSASKVGVYGAGRSGEMGTAFVRRLKH